jgi:hypothetical protein
VDAFDEEVNIFYHSAESMLKSQLQLDLFQLHQKVIRRKYDIYQEENLQVLTSSKFVNGARINAHGKG